MTMREAMLREPHDTEGKRSGASQAGEVLGVGLQFAGSIVLFLFVGRWLDGRLGTEPWLMILGVMIGAAAGFFSMYRQLVMTPQRRQQKREER
jgi:ATP synthase protein I